MNTYIVTGTTRGIGRALAETILADGDQLLSLSSAPDGVNGNWINVACDLSCSDTVVPCLKKLFSAGADILTGELVLINNAGVLAPTGPMGQVEEELFLPHLLVNQVAPYILISAFIRLTRDFTGGRRIINIASGAARNPYAGWGLYCASKAALEMMTLCAALEQKNTVNPVSVCAVSPGKVETDMQVAIRHSDPSQFPAQPKFVRAKEDGELLTPSAAARMLMELDKGGQLKNGGIYDLRDAIDKNGVLSIESITALM